MTAPLPLTVIGGYLGAGKTTLVNRLLRAPGGRRIGVIVNDFGSVAIDADLLAGATTDGDVIGLANGCVCCTVGAGLHEALAAIAERDVDHVVIEVSGVADPSVAAAWGTVPPFEPAGVIVLVAADQVMTLRNDRYVGAEVRRQVAGADLVLVTKTDRCDSEALAAVDAWLAVVTDAPTLRVVGGDVAVDVVLGVDVVLDVGFGLDGTDVGRRSVGGASSGSHDVERHDDRYASWSWNAERPISRPELERFVSELDPGVLRVKGWVLLDDGTSVEVQVVGRTAEVRPAVAAATGCRLVAIALTGTPNPFALHFG